MLKQMVVVSSLLAGIGSAGLVMHLQANPHALSHGNRVDLDTYLYSAKTEPLPKPETPTPAAAQDDADVLVLPEVVVTRVRPAESRAPVLAEGVVADPASQSTPAGTPALLDQERESVPAVAPRELKPCSEFRELGPLHVDDGVPSGVRGVRDLC